MNKKDTRHTCRSGLVVAAVAIVTGALTSACGGGGGGGGSAMVSGGGGGGSSTGGMPGGSAGTPDLGIGASLHGKQVFPADNAWNTPINNLPVDPNSATLIGSIGLNTPLHPDFGSNLSYGIPYMVVDGTQALEPMNFVAYPDESDPGPYPVPANAPIEGGSGSSGDRHVLIIDRDHWKLYELDGGYPQAGGSWNANCGATWDLNSDAVRPAGWTSADAAGLPIFPGLVRYDEVQAGFIGHAIRFTVQHSRHGYIYPARHYASSLTGTQYPPMGMRVRLKANFDISTFPMDARVILQAMKTYGMIVADNGSNWYFQGATDARWNDNDMNTIKTLTGTDFEVVQMGTIVTN